MIVTIITNIVKSMHKEITDVQKQNQEIKNEKENTNTSSNICKYCNSSNSDNATKCSSCGASLNTKKNKNNN